MSDRARWILHIDMDCFYVSAERLRDSKLAGKAVAVGGLGRRSVICSASYEARARGVRSAMPTSQAIRLCPELIVVPPSFSYYGALSSQVFKYLEGIAPVIQKVSVDEAYLDLTGCERLFEGRLASGEAVQKGVGQISNLPCSVGIATNKLLAKIASDFSKPSGLFEVAPGCEEKFLAPLPLSRLPGVGPKTYAQLRILKLETCGDLASKTAHWVKDELGSRGLQLQAMARGIHESPVHTDQDRKSYSAEETFDYDVRDPEILRRYLFEMSEQLAAHLRRDHIQTRTVQIKVRFPDFTTLTRARTLAQPTYLARDLIYVAEGLLREFDIRKRPIRLFGIGTRGLVEAHSTDRGQMDFFSEPKQDERQEKVERLKDELRDKFGKKGCLLPFE